MKKYTIILLTLFLPTLLSAQMWKRYRKQVTFGVGVTNFLGDLGGGNGPGVNNFTDLDFASTRFTAMGGFKYQVAERVNLRVGLQYALIKGDDSKTTEFFRNQRNLNFRSSTIEARLLGEFYFLKSTRGSTYRLKGVRGKNNLKLDAYFMAGVGFMYFNPKGELDGKWYALQPLGTEGQGLGDRPEKYKRTTFVLPVGIGVSKQLDRYWSIGLEFLHHFTFNDYLDDVSTTYYDTQKIIDAYGPLAGELAVKGGGGNGDEGQIRGDASNNDSFMTGSITLTRKLVVRRRSRPKF